MAFEPSCSPSYQASGNDEDADVDLPAVDLASFSDDVADIDVNRYIDLARRIPEDGFMPLIEAGHRDEIESGSPLGKRLHERPLMQIWNGACTMFFSQMNEASLIEGIAGNLDLAYRKSQVDGTALALHLDKVKKRARDQPSVYLRTLTDDEGNSMSVEDLDKVVHVVTGYLSDDPDADAKKLYFNIDKVFDDDDEWSQTKTAQGRRYYVENRFGKASISKIKDADRWLTAMKRRIEWCKAHGQDVLAPPCQYVGYAMNAEKREAQHQEGSSTSWIGQLVLAACEVLWPTKYSFKFFVVCLIFNEPLGLWLEIILSRYMRAYVIDGGFSLARAGISPHSLQLPKLTQEEREEFWDEMLKWVLDHTDMDATGKMELARREAYHARVLQERESALNESIEKKIESQTAFVEVAEKTHALLERNRGELTAKDPAKVARIDKRFTLAQRMREAWAKHKKSGSGSGGSI